VLAFCAIGLSSQRQILLASNLIKIVLARWKVGSESPGPPTQPFTFNMSSSSTRTISDLGPVYITVFIDTIGLSFSIPTLVYFVTSPEGLNGTAFDLGLTITAYSAASIFGTLFLGPFSDKYGRRPALLISIISSAITFFFQGVVTTVWQLLLCRIVSGIGGSAVPVAQAYVADVTTVSERPKFMGLIGAAVGIGFTVGPGLGAMVEAILAAAKMEQRMRFMVAFFISGSFCSLATLYVFLKLKEPKDVGWLITNDRNPGGVTTTNTVAVLWLAFASTCTVYTTTVMQSLWGLTIETFFGWKTIELGVCLLLSGFVIAGTQGAFPLLTKKVGADGACVVGPLTVAVGMLGFYFRIAGLHLFFFFLHTVGFGIINTCYNVLVSQYTSAGEQGKAQGYLASLGYLGRVLAPLFGGLLFDTSNTPRYVDTWLGDGYLAYLHGAVISIMAAGIPLGLKYLKPPLSAPGPAEQSPRVEMATCEAGSDGAPAVTTAEVVADPSATSDRDAQGKDVNKDAHPSTASAAVDTSDSTREIGQMTASAGSEGEKQT
jgi:DHA1 family tetracycline resistance protein-like MFS transporter